MTSTPVPSPRQTADSDRLRGVALGLGIPLGVFGAHRFYVGKVWTGLLQLCTFGGMGLWWLYDMILIASGEFRDEGDRRLSQWTRDDVTAARSRQPAVNMEELEGVHTELRELAERVDFLERMLSQARERGQLGQGGAGR